MLTLSVLGKSLDSTLKSIFVMLGIKIGGSVRRET